ncbi:hypothetical protein [Sedimenticola selenatireducens]|uniref:hypothetical protein n=1 Tax=Sedimenticola selenatireducens TaxID=191960 RepID=UPI0012FA5C61|nr:hypothetical protein [Sedimenticola selenatireducens]
MTGIRAILDRVGKEPISGTVIRGEQESSHMGFSFSFDDAREQVRIARCYLQNGSGMNWVGDRLLSARAYAIDAWLAAHGHPATGSFGDSYIVFIEKSSNELADRVSELSAGWALLDYQLLGDPEGMIDTLPLQEWKILAAEYLDLADQLIAYLRSDGEDF